MYVLGISGALGHDPAACLMKDGKIVAMVEEERISRKTHALEDTPLRAVECCLEIEGITLDEVSYIALSWDRSLFPKGKYFNPSYENIRSLFYGNRFKFSKFPKIEVVDHHLAHAASCYYFSDYLDSAVLVIDGSGEHVSTSMYIGKNGKLSKIMSHHCNESLGVFYNNVTKYLGFHWTETGKTMGLSSYGQPRYEFRTIRLDPDIGYFIQVDKEMNYHSLENYWFKEFLRMNIPPNRPERTYNRRTFMHHDVLHFDQIHLDFAASAQKILEECYMSLVKTVLNRTGMDHLCVAGGVALNCVANGKIVRSGIIKDMFIQPAAGDAGTAIGAAAFISNELGYKIEKLDHVYKGLEFSNDEIIQLAETLGCKFEQTDYVFEKASKFLADDQVIGWFQNRSEFGPRALGNRSILANPSIENIKDYVNNRVKLREAFRPFGPSVLEEHAADWFEHMTVSPYMLNSFYVKEEKIHYIPGVVHVDGSSRPQTVSKQMNPKYYELISQFYKTTGIPMVLNTSFNLKGEPMVCTPLDAIRTFYTSSLDKLILNDIVISK